MELLLLALVPLIAHGVFGTTDEDDDRDAQRDGAPQDGAPQDAAPQTATVDDFAGDTSDDLLSAALRVAAPEAGAGPDVLRGTETSDTLSGGPGDDLLEGAGLPDRLDGGGDDDTLRGGPGDDRLILGSGDTAAGQGGADSFALDAGAEPQTEAAGETEAAAAVPLITDFDAERDLLEITVPAEAADSVRLSIAESDAPDLRAEVLAQAGAGEAFVVARIAAGGDLPGPDNLVLRTVSPTVPSDVLPDLTA